MKKAEYGVIGVGTVGSMALWQLARRGHEAVGFEQFTPGHQKGAAAGDTRWVRTASEGAAYIPMMRRATGLWRTLEQDSGHRLLDLCGGLYVGPPTSSLIQDTLDNCSAFEVDHEVLSVQEARFRYPQFRIDDGEVVVLDHEAGQVHASLSVAVAAQTAEHFGATVVTNTQVIAVSPHADGISITTEEDEWLVEKLLVSTGPWGRTLLPDYIPHLDVERFLVSWYPVKEPELWSSDNVPILERQGEDFIFGSWPTADNASVKVGFAAAVDRLQAVEDMSQEITAEVIALTDRYVTQWLQGVVPRSVRHTVGMDAHTSDRNFLLGPLEEDPRIVLALGHGGHGFKMSPATGSVAADYLISGSSEDNLNVFSPNRFPVLPFLHF